MGWQQPDELPVTLSTLMAKAMNDQCIPPGEGILHHVESVDLIPANIELAGLEVALVNSMSREKMLKQVLDSARREYDYILLDCTPSLGMLTVVAPLLWLAVRTMCEFIIISCGDTAINALAAADTTLIPVQAQYLSAKGLEQLLQTIEELFPFREHPFKVLDDEAMQRTVESVAQYGVLAPLIARPRPEGGYEIISGHRRQHAAELAGLDTLPVIVRQMSDAAAVILMVDSNLQREHILPSERALAYKMKLDAMRRTSGRPSKENFRQLVGNFETADVVGKESGESGRQVQRFIRLTNLIPELLDLVDEKKISFNPAVELSYLDEAQQRDFLQAMDETQNAPSLSQAQRMKKLAQEGKFTYEAAFAIMGEAKKDELDKVVIKNDTLKKYFPRSYTPRQMEDVIIKLLEQWQRRQQRQNER